jgi:NitT/TauT family transport system substrate-binding protein
MRLVRQMHPESRRYDKGMQRCHFKCHFKCRFGATTRGCRAIDKQGAADDEGPVPAASARRCERRTRQPRWLLAAALVLLGPLLVGFHHHPTLRVGAHPWIGHETLFLARDFGWLPRKVVLRERASLGDSVAALAAGKVHAAALTLEEMLLARSRGVPLTAVLVFDISTGADVLLARPELPDLAALAGRRIGIEHSALGPLLLSRALAEAGLTPTDVKVLDLAPDRQAAAWQQGAVDAVVSYGPAVSALEALGAHRLFDSSRMPERIFDVLAVRQEQLLHPALPALLAAHFRGLQHLRHSREDAIYRIAARHGDEVAAVRQNLAGIHTPDLVRNRSLLAAGGEVEQAAQELHALMLGQGLLATADSLQLVCDNRLVLALSEPVP